jgi:ribosome-associated toxin RatA of RatAB toxin-antitoxin module
MKAPRRRLLAASATLVAFLGLVPGAARADDEVDRLKASPRATRYELKTTAPPSSIDTGGAAILVNAPIAEVRRIVTDYAHYETILKPFDQSRVLSRRKGWSEVYLQVPILHGAAKIWAVVLIPPPVKDGPNETITVRFDRGNVADMRATWRMRAVDADHTVLKIELLVDPKMPFPASVITPELKAAADAGVTAVRDHAEQRAREAQVAALQADEKKEPPVAKR